MTPQRFIETMSRWRQYFLDSIDLPVIGLSEESIRKIASPACVVPGHDEIHPQRVGEELSKLLANAELHYEPARPPSDASLSRSERQRPLAEIFLSFLERRGSPPRD